MDIGEKEEGKASGGSFVRSAGKRPRTKDDDEDDWEAEDLTVKNPRLTNKLIICFILWMDPVFDHEKLDVYCLELGFVAWLTAFLDDASHWSAQHRRELIEQLDRASLSVLLNTAEGKGERQGGPSFSRTPVARPSSAPPALIRRSPKASSRSIAFAPGKKCLPVS